MSLHQCFQQKSTFTMAIFDDAGIPVMISTLRWFCSFVSGPMYSCFFTCCCASRWTVLFPHDSDTKGQFILGSLAFSLCACWIMVVESKSLLLQGITTYEYVVAMRAQSEPPGPSVDGEDQHSLPSSPTSSAVTAISGKSSVGRGLQYKGAWCTPPRIFMDHQVLQCIVWS